MSLIIDALKKTQQLRLNGSEGSSLLSYPSPNRTGRRNSKRQWIVIGAGLICLCILLFVFLRPGSSPLATQTNEAIIPLETKHSAVVPKKEEPTEGLHDGGSVLSSPSSSVPVAEKVSSEPPKEVSSLPKDKEPSPADLALNSFRLGQDSKQPVTQKPSNATVARSDRPPHPIKEKAPSTAKLSLLKQAPNPPLPPMTQKEEASPKSIALEQEGGKDHLWVTEVLNHFNSGVAFYNQKEFSKAIQAYQKVIELDPTYVEAYNNLGIIYQTMGDAKSAFGAYQKATEINPRYAKGYNNLGLLFLLEGRYEEALEVFQKALAINANHIESHINLGILFKKKGQWENAIESYQKALAIDPLHRETHYNMALLYEQLENWELAISHYQQFIQLSSKSYPELVARVQRHLNALVEARKEKRP